MFEFSEKDRKIRVHNYSPLNNEYIGDSDAWIAAKTGLPANATDIAPPAQVAGMAVVFNGDGWDLVEDYRGQLIYDTSNGSASTVYALGAIPVGKTLKRPTSSFDVWVDEGWKKDTAKEAKSLIEDAKLIKQSSISLATMKIQTLDDAVSFNMATDEEKALLQDWKMYRVLVNRVEVRDAPKITWPVAPEESVDD